VTAFEELLRTPVESRNFPEAPLSVHDVRSRGYRLDDLWLPSAVIDESALNGNLRRFADWCAERGVDLAPHGKTTMAPQLWRRQLDQGAWGITAATVAQARLMHRHGTPRVQLANEVVDPRQADWLARVNRPGRRYYSLIDSESGLRLLEQAAAKAEAAIPVLVELGVPGRRTGVRTVEDGLALARLAHRSVHLELVGVEGYEGVLPQARDDDAVAAATVWLGRIAELARRADESGLFAGSEEIILTAGGSGYPDLAADALTAVDGLSLPPRLVIRSGCYLTHDHLSYERSSPLRSAATEDPLLPALSCYAYVNSTPEAGRALLTAGKRDVPIDYDLPVLLRARDRDGAWSRPRNATVVEVNDHHAFVDDPDSSLSVGQLVELGLSHPCTSFDKWRLIPVVDDDGVVVDAVATLF